MNFNVTTRNTELTPLMIAAMYSRKNSVLWLLQDGEEVVDTKAVDPEGRNVIHLAAFDMQCQYTIEVWIIIITFIFAFILYFL